MKLLMDVIADMAEVSVQVTSEVFGLEQSRKLDFLILFFDFFLVEPPQRLLQISSEMASSAH